MAARFLAVGLAGEAHLRRRVMLQGEIHCGYLSRVKTCRDMRGEVSRADLTLSRFSVIPVYKP
jgi:hypothetical protein